MWTREASAVVVRVRVALGFLMLAAFGLLAASCNGSDGLAIAPLPTATVAPFTSVPVSPSPVPSTPTPRPPTATPVPPTATPTVTPQPTATSSDLYGDLIIEGIFDWPRRMPDNATPDIIQAINIYVSYFNLSFGIGQGDFEPTDSELLNGFVEPAALSQISNPDEAIEFEYVTTDGDAPNRVAWVDSVLTSGSQVEFEVCSEINRTRFDAGNAQGVVEQGFSRQSVTFVVRDAGPVLQLIRIDEAGLGELCP